MLDDVNPDEETFVRRMFDVSGRVALVTGSTRGIGRELATVLLRAGCTTVVNGRSSERTQQVREQLATLTGGRVHAVSFDVTDPEAVAAGIAQAEAIAGDLDILVNNVGDQRRAPLISFPDEDWNALLATNLTGAFLASREVARRMVPRGHGKIINICSVQSELARPGIAAYAATKGALKMLTKGMCADLAPSGIQVNAIGPGYFDTELTAELVADADFSEWVRRRTPAGRWGRMADLAGTLIYLCSDASDFVNGQAVYVDGGMLSVL
jgi:gluconate 5-dehydrogenase